MPKWKTWQPDNMPEDVFFATDGYEVCPVCRTNDNIENIGDDRPHHLSFWKCIDCHCDFTTYDEHEHYIQTYRDDHYDFYYILNDFDCHTDNYTELTIHHNQNWTPFTPHEWDEEFTEYETCQGIATETELQPDIDSETCKKFIYHLYVYKFKGDWMGHLERQTFYDIDDPEDCEFEEVMQSSEFDDIDMAKEIIYKWGIEQIHEQRKLYMRQAPK